jgi:L-cysteine/cystine lyase
LRRGWRGRGRVPVAVDELGADAYAIPAQKWLLGPEGMGALWVRRDGGGPADARPAGFLAYATPGPEPTLHPGARRFEGTNYHRPSIVGFARACGWLTMYVGLPWAVERAARLAAAAADRLAAIPGVTLLTPRARMATLVTFRIAGWPATAAVAELGARSFANLRDLPALDALRISVGVWATEEELERFAGTVGSPPTPRHDPSAPDAGRPRRR